MKLYVGAGVDRKEGWKHLDIVNLPGIDYVCDVEQGLPFDDSSIDEIFTQDFLEHLHPEKRVFVMSEFYRVLKPGGVMEHWCPYAGSKNDFASPSHLSHWNERTFEYFENGNRRFEMDTKWNGFKGAGFQMVTNQPCNEQEGQFQGIHVIMRKI